MVRLTDSYLSVVSAVENNVPLLKLLIAIENGHLFSPGGIEWTLPEGFLSPLITTGKSYWPLGTKPTAALKSRINVLSSCRNFYSFINLFRLTRDAPHITKTFIWRNEGFLSFGRHASAFLYVAIMVPTLTTLVPKDVI